MSHKICPLPWNHISIQQNGDYRLCCQCVHPPFGKPKTADGESMSIQISDINDVRNSELHKRIRMQMIQGIEPDECKLCWDEEHLGFKSKRIHMLGEYSINNVISNTQPDGTIDTDSFPLQYIDIRFGNLCNLKCRTCGPSDSSLWYSDWVELNNTTHFNFYSGKDYQLEKINNTWALKNTDFEWYDDKKSWEVLASFLPTVDRLYLTGGEPLINKLQWRILELCVQHGYAKNIILEYNSNMTRVTDHALSVWKHFKSVNIGCSVDAVGELANYIRYPSDWKDVVNTLGMFNKYDGYNLMAKFSPTVSVFNVLGLLELSEWLYHNRPRHVRPMPSYHLLHGPYFQNLTVLPLTVKQWITDQYNTWYSQESWREPYRKHFAPILDFMMSQDNTHLLPQLKYNTSTLDRIRNQNVRNYLPWLADILDNTVDN